MLYEVITIYAPTDTYDVVMELAPRYQANPAALAMLPPASFRVDRNNFV